MSKKLESTGKKQQWRVAAMGFPGHWRFMGPLTEQGFCDLQSRGFNAVALWVSHRISASHRPGDKLSGDPGEGGRADWWNEEATLDRIAGIAEMAAKHKLRLFPMLYVGQGAGNRAGIRLPPARSEEGKISTAICPVASELWDEFIFSQAEAFAKVSRSHPVEGILLELEIYGGADAAGSGYWKKHCCCDRCLKEFLGKSEEPEAAAAPRAWLESQGLWEDFSRRQEDMAFRKISDWRKRLQAINDKLRFGFYSFLALENAWRIRQAARALYDGSAPLLYLDSSTYYESNSLRSPDPSRGRVTMWEWIDYERANFNKLGVEADICFGCYPESTRSNYSMKEIERHAFISGVCADGYWVWNERRDPIELQLAYHTANTWLDLAAKDFDVFARSVADRVRVSGEQGFDVAFSNNLMDRARQARKANDARMATIWAYQAFWNLAH